MRVTESARSKNARNFYRLFNESEYTSRKSRKYNSSTWHPTVCPQHYQSCVYRKFDSGWTQRTDGISSRPDEGSVQADSRRTGFALQVESKAGSRNPDPTATDQCALPAGIETTAPQQYRSFSVCLALSLVPLRPWRDCDCQAGDDHSLAPRWVSSVLALAIAQPCWQTEGLG